jgi:hypothetical protein
MKTTYRVEMVLAGAGFAEAAKLEAALAELTKANPGLTVERFSAAGKPRKPAAVKPAKLAG